MKITFRDLAREKELWMLVCLALLYCVRPLLFGESFFFRDLYLYFLPQKRLLAEFLARGEWPLWDSYLHGGQPYWAAMGNAVWYPFNILYAMLPLLTAFNLIIALHLIFCAAAAYLFARVAGLSPVSALIAGAAYAFCGVTLSEINLLNTFLAAPYLPLLLLCWHLFLQRRERRWFVLAVFAASMRLLLGASEQYVIGMAFLLGWTFCITRLTMRFRAGLAYLALLNLFAFGIAAIQLLPTIEMLSQSSRGAGHNFHAFAYWSLSPLRLPEMIFPQFCGMVDTLVASDYWGRNIDNDAPVTLILSIYWGAALLFLAVSAGIGRGEGWPLPARARRFLFVMLFGSILLATGRFLPFFETLYTYLPAIRIFRFPVKFLIAGILPAAMLAGCAAERYFSTTRAADCPTEFHGWQPSFRFLTGIWIASGALLSVTLLFAASPDFSAQFQRAFFQHAGNDVSQQGLSAGFSHAFGIWLLFTILFQYRRYKVTPWQSGLLAAIILADLFISGLSVNPTAPRKFYTDVPPVVHTVRQHLRNGRLYRTTIPRNPILHVPSNEIVWGNRWNLDILADYSASFYGIPIIFHDDFDKLANIRIMTFKAMLERAAWPQKLPLLSAAGVTTILTDAVISADGAQFVADVPNNSNLAFHLYENRHALEPVQMVQSWEYAASDDEVERAMLQPGYDPRRHVVLQNDRVSSFFTRILRRVESPPLPPSLRTADCAPAVLHDLRTTSTEISVAVRAACDGMLVFPQPFYSEWRGEIDGASAPLLRANLAFSALFVPQGEHRIRLFYSPVSLLAGSATSLCSLVLLVSVLFIRRVFNRL